MQFAIGAHFKGLQLDVLCRFEHRADFNPNRILKIVARHFPHRTFEGSRVAECLVHRRDGRHDAANGRLEAHVEHAIDFVQHQDFDLVELDQPASEKIFQTAGSGHDEARTATDRVQLRTLGHATDDQRGGKADQLRACLLYLHREFARGQQDQCARNLGLCFLQLLDDGNEEAERLAGTGLCSGQYVPALKRRRNRSHLYWGERNKVCFGKTLLERRRNG